MLSAAISVSVNSANAANWRSFTGDFCAQLARGHRPARVWLTKTYLAVLGHVLDLLEHSAARSYERRHPRAT